MKSLLTLACCLTLFACNKDDDAPGDTSPNVPEIYCFNTAGPEDESYNVESIFGPFEVIETQLAQNDFAAKYFINATVSCGVVDCSLSIACKEERDVVELLPDGTVTGESFGASYNQWELSYDQENKINSLLLSSSDDNISLKLPIYSKSDCCYLLPDFTSYVISKE